MRTLNELFSKYTAEGKQRQFFDSVREYSVKKHREKPIYEISVKLDRIFDKQTIYGAEPIYIECTKEQAYDRLQVVTDGRDIKEYKKYIDTWFERYQE